MIELPLYERLMLFQSVRVSKKSRNFLTRIGGIDHEFYEWLSKYLGLDILVLTGDIPLANGTNTRVDLFADRYLGGYVGLDNHLLCSNQGRVIHE